MGRFGSQSQVGSPDNVLMDDHKKIGQKRRRNSGSPKIYGLYTKLTKWGLPASELI